MSWSRKGIPENGGGSLRGDEKGNRGGGRGLLGVENGFEETKRDLEGAGGDLEVIGDPKNSS